MTLTDQIARLRTLSTAELAAEYERLHGRRPRYRSVPWLRKRIAFELQVRAFGGLPAAAKAAIAALAAELELPATAARPATATAATIAPAPLPDAAPTNAGLPIGTVLVREWRGQRIAVEVRADGLWWRGDRFGSLSAVACAVTGARWNGRLFFGLQERTSP
jgi:hypothetical protein